MVRAPWAMALRRSASVVPSGTTRVKVKVVSAGCSFGSFNSFLLVMGSDL